MDQGSRGGRVCGGGGVIHLGEVIDRGVWGKVNGKWRWGGEGDMIKGKD